MLPTKENVILKHHWDTIFYLFNGQKSKSLRAYSMGEAVRKQAVSYIVVEETLP